MQKVGALWLKEGEKGKFMAGELDLGVLGKVSLMVFKNNKKEKAEQPDYLIYLPGESKEEEQNEQSDEGFF